MTALAAETRLFNAVSATENRSDFGLGALKGRTFFCCLSSRALRTAPFTSSHTDAEEMKHRVFPQNGNFGIATKTIFRTPYKGARFQPPVVVSSLLRGRTDSFVRT
jgi:hypothetical protein